MKITLLIHNVYAIGGTIRTTLNLAAALADRHEVTIVSMLRHRTRPRFVIDPRVTVVPLVDIRADAADAADPLLHQPAEVFPPPRSGTGSTAASPTSGRGSTCSAATQT
ncbi:hypothetical protein SANTM175S_08219 [Streptomyces antimycoticus]